MMLKSRNHTRRNDSMLLNHVIKVAMSLNITMKKPMAVSMFGSKIDSGELRILIGSKLAHAMEYKNNYWCLFKGNQILQRIAAFMSRCSRGLLYHLDGEYPNWYKTPWNYDYARRGLLEERSDGPGGDRLDRAIPFAVICPTTVILVYIGQVDPIKATHRELNHKLNIPINIFFYLFLFWMLIYTNHGICIKNYVHSE